LEKQDVGLGDIFLFFGWFRHTEYDGNGRLAYTGSPKGFHALFGWLQVGKVYHVNRQPAEPLPSWLEQQHPHAQPDTRNAFGPKNTIYVGSEHLKIGDESMHVSGGGTFSRALRLTKPGEKRRTIWALPKWFYPGAPKKPLSYHGNPERWSVDGDSVILKTVSKGQEFVLDTQSYPEALDWVGSLFGPA
jgi:hypothetical protein